MTDLPDLLSLSNPHVLCCGEDPGDCALRLVTHFRAHADVWIVSSRLSPLQRHFGNRWEAADRLLVPPRVLDSIEGHAIARAAIDAALQDPALAKQVSPETVKRHLDTVDLEQRTRDWGRAALNTNAYQAQGELAPDQVQDANAYLAILDLPPLDEQSPGRWIVWLHEAKEGANLSRYGLEPVVDETVRMRDLAQRTSTLRHKHPRADEAAVRELAVEQQQDALWSLALRARAEETYRQDVHGVALCDRLDSHPELRPLLPIINQLVGAGDHPLGRFTPGQERFLDVEECSALRRLLILAAAIMVAQESLADGRWRCLVIDDYAIPLTAIARQTLDTLLRQGRKAGLGVILVQHGEPIPEPVLELIGNRLAKASSPRAVGFPAVDGEERLLGLARVARQHLDTRFVMPITGENAAELQASDLFPEVLNLGGFHPYENGDVAWQRPDGQWFRLPNAREMRGFRGRVDERNRDHEQLLLQIKSIREAMQVCRPSRYWWYAVASGATVPLHQWR